MQNLYTGTNDDFEMSVYLLRIYTRHTCTQIILSISRHSKGKRSFLFCPLQFGRKHSSFCNKDWILHSLVQHRKTARIAANNSYQYNLPQPYVLHFIMEEVRAPIMYNDLYSHIKVVTIIFLKFQTSFLLIG